MTCNDMNSKLAGMLFETQELNAGVNLEAQSHLAECGACRLQLDELRATMALLDTWEVPEPNPYFLTRFNARMVEEREAAPANWFERVRARLVYGSRLTLRPVAAMATAMTLTVGLLVGGGAYLSLNNWEQPEAVPGQAAVVHDLQTLDNNAQLLDQLETLSTENN